MQPDWQKFLLLRGGPSGTPSGGSLLTDLSQSGLIRVDGDDAVAFLQGQLSTDVEKLTPQVCQLSSWNNAKGRVVTLLHLFRRGDSIYLSLPASLLSPVLKRLSMYILRAKVTLADVGDGFVRFGLAGPDASKILAQAGAPVPAEAYGIAVTDGAQVMHLYGATPRYAVHGTAEAMIALWEKLEGAGAHPADEQAWMLQKILAGEPSVFPESSERFVAQMLDLDKLGAVDFKKGCYIGQEVIARSHYRGGVKRHLARASSASSAPLKPGSDIHALGQDSPVAEVVDARTDSQGLWQMLVVVQDEYRDADMVHVASGASVKILNA